MDKYESSELILSETGSIYHLNLTPDQIAKDIILVGDPARVQEISSHFDTIEHRVFNREFVTHTGYIGHKRLSVISSGIGTDNIDIVVNELDALVNIDLKKRIDKPAHQSLNLIRLGTSGALSKLIEVDHFVISKYALGIDNLALFYELNEHLIDHKAVEAFIKQSNWNPKLCEPYIIKSSDSLDARFHDSIHRGITVTAPGFYGPQGRILRVAPADPEQNNKLANFQWNGFPVTNYEMETSALYALGQQLGHNTLTICAIIANRPAGTYSKNHKKTVQKLIDRVLNAIIKE
ncbi:MAG: nucleoside phosphorylase [Bacteroidales bacterium]